MIFLYEIDNWQASFSCFLDAVLSFLLLFYFIKIKLLFTKIYRKLMNKKTELLMKNCEKDVSNILAILVTSTLDSLICQFRHRLLKILTQITVHHKKSICWTLKYWTSKQIQIDCAKTFRTGISLLVHVILLLMF